MSTISYRSAASVLIHCMFCLSSLFFIEPTFAQEIRGTVRDHEGTRLPGVNVTIPALATGAVTDNEGKYVLNRLAAGD